MAETTVFTVRVTPELKDKLDVLAEAMDRPRSWVVNHALEGYVEAQMSFIEAVQEGIASAERGDAVGGFAADVGTGDGEDFGTVDGAHHLPTAGRDTRLQQESIEVDALVAQRIAFVDADHRGRQSP